MKILIVSDSHGRSRYLDLAYERVKPIDMLIHLGDLEGDEEHIRSLGATETVLVSGNNDYFTDLPREEFIEIGHFKVMVTHGHRYSVNFKNDIIKDAARKQGADIVMYGHTHRPLIDMSWNEIWAVNPGSISLPRQEGNQPSFILMELDRYGDAHFTINYIRGKNY